jgi:hypothetical protein
MIEPRKDAWPKDGSGTVTGVRPEPIPDTIAQPPPSREHLRQLIFTSPEPKKAQ